MSTLAPLTADERQLLQARARGVGWEMARSFLFGGLFLTSILFLVLFTAWKFFGPGLGFPAAKHQAGAVLAVAATLSAGFLLPGLRSALAFARNLSPQARLAQEDLAAGQAKIETLTITAADELPEFEDEGTGFFLQLADSRVLYVQGQDLYDYAHDAENEENAEKAKVFPATIIRYRIAPRSGLRLGLEPAGAYLPAVLLASRRFGRDDAMPEDGVFYDGTLADTRRKFGLKSATP